MCGIFGILDHRSTEHPDADRLRETARRMNHRGPDGSGIDSAPGAALVHTRLSLVDLNERSNQPFRDDTGRYSLVYNGELYDYAALRSALEQKGARFHTTSDTEVLLAALTRLGVEEALSRIEGMFSFALFDRKEESLVVARDRLGIKPLYVFNGPDAFVFGSTVRGMAPWITLRPNSLIVASYLQGFHGPMTGHSFYEGVDIVPPGAVVRIRRGGTATYGRYFQLRDLADPARAESLARRAESDVIDETEQLLLAAVNSQLVADVPVGAFCSGGVDSSLIMAMAARSHGDLQVFHADVEGRLSERDAAEVLARHLKLDLRIAPVRDHHFVDTIPAVVEHFELPFFVHPTSVPLFQVSALVRQHGVKAVLSGEGSDECYLGYPWLVPNIPAALARLPRRLAHHARALFGSARVSDPAAGDRALTQGLFSQFERELGPEVHGATAESRKVGSSGSLANGGELSYILRTLLHRNDTMGMASSVECRFPFLDTRLLRLATNLPEHYKVRFSASVRDPDHPFYRDKWIIRHIADRYVPRSLSQRSKRQFPTTAFRRTRVADAFFQNSFVSDWFGLSQSRLQHLLDGASNTLRLRLLHLEAWGERCLRESPAESLAGRLARHVSVSAPN